MDEKTSNLRLLLHNEYMHKGAVVVFALLLMFLVFFTSTQCVCTPAINLFFVCFAEIMSESNLIIHGVIPGKV